MCNWRVSDGIISPTMVNHHNRMLLLEWIVSPCNYCPPHTIFIREECAPLQKACTFSYHGCRRGGILLHLRILHSSSLSTRFPQEQEKEPKEKWREHYCVKRGLLMNSRLSTSDTKKQHLNQQAALESRSSTWIKSGKVKKTRKEYFSPVMSHWHAS